MARPRTPTALLLLNGGAAHDKKRYQDRIENEPVDDEPIGEFVPPKLMTTREAWDFIVSICPANVLRKRDRAIVMRTAIYYRDQNNSVVLGDLEGRIVTQETGYISAERQLKSCLMALGLSPADASRVAITKPKGKRNEFSD